MELAVISMTDMKQATGLVGVFKVLGGEVQGASQELVFG